MPGPQTPAAASSAILPPVSNTPVVDPGTGVLTVAGLNLFQQIWAGVFGSGGVAQQLPVAGDLKPIAGATVLAGWLICDGTAYQQSSYPNLFAAIGTVWGTGGPGTFRVPDLRGRLLLGADGAHPLGATGGNFSLTLSEANLPAYFLPVSDPGHVHIIVDPGHTHVVTDPKHTHTVTDPGHVHTITDPGHHHTGGSSATNTNTAGAAAGTSTAANTGDATTGVTVNSATTGVTNQTAATGITNNAATTGISDDSAVTGITVSSGGSASPIDITPPFAAVNWIIKT